jgi:uncharacterized membrane protein
MKNSQERLYQFAILVMIWFLGISIGISMAKVASGCASSYTHISLILTFLVIFFDITLLLDIEDSKC